jgi:hypothetical protein
MIRVTQGIQIQRNNNIYRYQEYKLMRISTRQLSSIIKEAIQSPIDLDSMSDKDLQDLNNKVEQMLKQRAAQAKRNSFTSLQQAASYLEDVAIGDALYDDAKVAGAGDFIVKNGTTPPDETVRRQRVDAVLDLVGHMSQIADEMNNGAELSDDDEKVQRSNYTKLQKLMANIGIKI